MGVQSQLLETAKGKEVEVFLTAAPGRLAGVIEVVAPDALMLRDGPDDVWVSLAAVVAVRVHARATESTGRAATAAIPKVKLFCRQCGYERIGREPGPGEEAPPTPADRAAAICPVCGSTRWTRERPQV